MIYCSKETGLFHDSDLGDDLPSDAIEISRELHAELLNGQSQFLRISFDTYPPALIERPPLQAEQLAELERVWRNAQLLKTDGVVARQRDELEAGGATTFTAERYAELQAYRQELRTWPQGALFPTLEHRPVAPDWLTDQT
jgi:hypothetical protein